MELHIFHPACRGGKRSTYLSTVIIIIIIIIHLFILLLFFFLVKKLCFAVAATPEREMPLNCNFLSLKAIYLLVKFIIWLSRSLFIEAT